MTNKCQFRLDAEEKLRAGSIDFKDCGKDTTNNLGYFNPVNSKEWISLDLCDKYYRYMTESLNDAESGTYIPRYRFSGECTICNRKVSNFSSLGYHKCEVEK